MKTILHKSRASVALTASLLAISMGLSRADVVSYQNTFDDSSSFTTGARTYNPPPIWVGFDYGTATASATHAVAWSTNDAAASPSSGSLGLSWAWSETADGDGSAAFIIDVTSFGATITNASSLEFDVMVDPASTPDAYGGNGYFQVITRDENYAYNVVNNFSEELGNPTFGAPNQGTWQHVLIPLSGVNTVIRALEFQDYDDAGRNINGNEIIYIDNLTINVPGVLLPPTNSISKTGAKGLYLLTTPNVTVDAQQYQRQGIETAAAGYGWAGSGANPVTYSVTVSSFPGPAYSNFEAYVFLVPSPIGTEANPDWVEYDCATLSIQNNADGTARASFGYKLNDADDNALFINLGQVTNTSALGTWSVTFTNNDDVVLTAPGGNTLVTNLTSGDGGNFSSPLAVYLGVEPNSTNNTGQQAIFSQFQIVSNGIPLLSDAFTSQTLANTWSVAAEDPGGVLQVPPSAAYTLTWNLPDTGFNLQANTNLANTGSWFDPGLPKSLFNGQRTVLIPASWAATNNPGFFRLINP